MDAASAAKARLPLGGQAHQLYGLLNEHGYELASLHLSMNTLTLEISIC